MTILLLILLAFAILAVEAKNLFYSVVFLGLVGITLGLIFFSLHANLVGVFQAAVYGGISVILIFLIMMVGEKDE